MTQEKPKRLTALTIDEISLVDRPANEGARVLLYKRDEGMDDKEKVSLIKKLAQMVGLGEADVEAAVNKEKETPVTKGNEDKQLAELTAKVAKLQAERDVAVAKTEDELKAVEKTVAEGPEENREALTKAIADKRAELDKLEKAGKFDGFRQKLPKAVKESFDKMTDDEKENFMNRFGKAEDGDPVAKSVEKLASDNETLRKTVERLERDANLAKVRDELKDLADVVKVDELAETVLKLRNADMADDAERVIVNYRAMSKQAADSEVFKVYGANYVPEGSAADKVEKLAEKRAAEDKITKEAAYSAVLQENPDLYTAMEAEKENK